MNQASLFNLSWGRYLNLLFLLLTVGFLSSGIVTFIAANWDYFSDLSKIYGLQMLFVFSIILGGYFFLRESRQLVEGQLKIISVALFFSGAVLIGGTLALVGQTYQTGANTWELFAVWSLCQIPWLLLLPNVASALLLMTTANLAFYLMDGNGFYGNAAIYGVIFNGFCLVFSEIFIKQLHDQRWRVLPKILVGLVTLHLLEIRFIVEEPMFEVDLGWFSLFHFLLSGVSLGALFYFYYQYRFDFTNLITLTIGMIVAFSMLLFPHINSAEAIFSCGLLVFLLTMAAMKRLYKLYKVHYPQHTKMPWALSILFMFAILIGMVTAIIWVGFMLDVADPLLSILVLAIVILITALGLHRTHPQLGNSMSLVVGICFLMGYGLLVAYLWLNNLDNYSTETTRFGTPLLFTCVVGCFYFVHKEAWLQTLSICVVLIMWYLSYVDEIISGVLPLPYLSMLCCAFVFFWQGMGKISHRKNEQLAPLAWGLLFFSIGSWVTSSNLFFPWRYHFSEMADELPSIATFSDVFNVITYGVFSRATFTASWVIPLLVCLTPLGGYWIIHRFLKCKVAGSGLIVFVLILFTLGFVAQPSVLFWVSLWFMAYFMGNRYLFFITLFTLIINLALYYYQLFIPLLYKSFLLLFFGVLFGCVACYLHQTYKKVTQSEVNFSRVSILKPLLASFAVLFILSPLNYKIWQFENVLATGKPVILKISPVDPRSLMQGDYMSLNYDILMGIRVQLNEFANDSESPIDEMPEPKQPSKRLYALIHQNGQGVATLCRVESRIPTDFLDCVPDVYLPINNVGWFPTLPSQEYFFAEGKGQHYAQAEYAEYRFKDGILLLARLLDKNLKPL